MFCQWLHRPHMAYHCSLGAIASCVDRANNRDISTHASPMLRTSAIQQVYVGMVYPTPEKLGPFPYRRWIALMRSTTIVIPIVYIICLDFT